MLTQARLRELLDYDLQSTWEPLDRWGRPRRSHQEAGRTMHYPIVIEPSTSTSTFGVIVPDFPGCFSAGDTLEAAFMAAKKAAAAWLDTALDADLPIAPPSSVDEIRSRPEYAVWIIGVIELDDTLFDDTIERVNITLPRRVLRRLDAIAKAHGESRGSLITHLTLCRGQ